MSQWNLLDFFLRIQLLLLFYWFVASSYNYISSAVVGILRSLEGRTFTIIGVPDTPRRDPSPDISRFTALTLSLVSISLLPEKCNDIVIQRSPRFSVRIRCASTQ